MKNWATAIVLAVIVIFGIVTLGDGGCRPGLFNLDFRPVRHKTINIYLLRWVKMNHSGHPRRLFIKATDADQARELAAAQHGNGWLLEDNATVHQLDVLFKGSVGICHADQVP